MLVCAPAGLGEVLVTSGVVGDGRVVTGEEVEFRVHVQYTDRGFDPRLDLRVLEGVGGGVRLAGTANSERTEVVFEGGRTRQVTEYARLFTLLVSSAGIGEASVIEIPAIEVIDGAGVGTGVFTEPTRLVVEAPAERSDFRIRVSVSDEEVWVGEPFEVTLELMVESGARLSELTFDAGGLEEWVRVVGAREMTVGSVSGGFLGPSLNATQVGEVREGGVTMLRYLVRREVVARRAGSFEVGPIVATATLRSPGFRRAVRVGVPSNSVGVRVRALPRDGMPAGFGGLIGRYAVETSVSERSVRVGDPLTLRVTVSSADDLEGVVAPELAGREGFAGRFRVRRVDEPAVYRETRTRRQKTFEYVLRALDAGVDEVPAVELAYFDAEAGGYRVARSEAIPLEVEAGERVTVRDPVEAERGSVVRDGGGGAVGGGLLGDSRDDLAANVVGDGLEVDRGFDVGRAVRDPLVAAAIGAPPVLYGLGWCAVVVRRRAVARGGVRSAAAAARAGAGVLDGGGDVVERVAGALVAYAAARRGVDAGAVTPGEAVRMIEEEREDLRERAEVLASHVDAARYGGAVSSGDGAALVEEAGALLRLLGKGGG